MKIYNEKSLIWTPSGPPLPPTLGGSIADSPLNIWDVMPPYLKTLFEQKTENW